MVTPSGAQRSSVAISDGRIVAVGPSVDGDGPVVDAGDLLVLPGMVDAHVHFDEPGREAWEGFDTGSAAAVAGGVTTVVDMPIDCDPPTIRADAVAAKAACLPARSRVDVAMWGGLVPSSVEQLAAMAAAGVVGFKAFACPSGWDEFPAAPTEVMDAGLRVAAALDLPVAVHCELEPLGHTVSSEVAAIGWAAGLARAAGARLHVVHVSSAAGVDEARRWAGVTVETCPHYLLLPEDGGRCFPPIRSTAERAALWARVRDGLVDCVASDHSPCPPSLGSTWAGLDGVGMTLPLLLSSGVDVCTAVALTTAAARLLRLPGKGTIAPGYDADIVLVDPAASWTVTAADIRTRHGMSPYIGRALRGRVVQTMVRGRAVFSDGNVGPPGGGAVVSPQRSAR